ncbi:hypothetical protein BT63DRAFT_442580 [Microthyrium microscopicum]|uniref:HTH araC/xylS-type domain-containing protein n=1 Tax=Microthyrium microscopicum TaxID=703497 RepID=A0A6A6U4F6_9PEZI|nr:hypothetical protein BT63DRAFT_442580 [Microthyrium microscopicum]
MAASTFTTDSARWAAVQSRLPAADGHFVYCVRTTHIYCRPVCKARPARRANVEFRTTPFEAEEAGYRACKRCKPALASSMPEDDAVIKVRQWLADDAQGKHVQDGKSLQSLRVMAKETGLSKWHFHRVFKKVVGVTPVEYARMCRSLEESLGESSSASPASTGLESLSVGELGGVIEGMPFPVFAEDSIAIWPTQDEDSLWDLFLYDGLPEEEIGGSFLPPLDPLL